jgi:AraC-like DNA-binding protein
MTELIKVNNIEDIEILTMVGQKQSFPNHFHNTFCISLITEGIECIEMDKKLIYSKKKFISISNPYEIHSNPLMYKNQKLSFHTIYFPQIVIDDIAGRKNVFFEKRSFKDLKLNTYLIDVIKSTKKNQNELNPSLLKKFIERLIIHSSENIKKDDLMFKNNWDKAIKFIDENLKNNVNLETLASSCKMDKFKFAKSFKYFCGISPMNYMLIKRVFEAKETISKETNLTALAYEFNFTDMSHFSRQFNRYIGLSPKKYQQSLSE